MNSIRKILPPEHPALLREIYDPPKFLYIQGKLPDKDINYVYLTVVGSRKNSEYGKTVTETLIESLKGLPVVIVSGLAYGIDSIAHRSALRAGLITIAVPGSGLNPKNLYPASHKELAEEIVAAGGAVLSPFENDTVGNNWTFPARNRIMAGMAHATLVIEAEIKSGTLITSKYATDFNRNVLTVPGQIFASQSAGPHMLIRLGATPITTGAELVEALGFKTDIKREEKKYSDLSPDEMKIIKLLQNPIAKDILFEKLDMETGKINSLISFLELKGLIKEECGELRLI